jgi:diguanylate cyclase (GGDEF)-like protein
MDYVTLFAVLVSALLIEMLVLTLTWRQNRNETGLRDWAVGYGLMAVSCLVSAAGLVIEPGSPAPSMVLRTLSSALGTAGWMMAWIGTRHFHARPAARYRTVAIFIVVALVVLAIRPEAWWRIMLTSTAVAVFAALILKEFASPSMLREPARRLVAVALLLCGISWGWRAVEHIDTGDAILTSDVVMLYVSTMASLALTLAMMVLTNERINSQLRSQTSRDSLTGIMNRRAFYEASAPMLANLKRDNSRLAICMLDIDHFKSINGLHGHAVGDEVLRQFAQMARSALREGDLLARYGGEEFVALLHNSDQARAGQVIDRLRMICAEQGVTLSKGRIDIKFSAGIACVSGPVNVSMESLLNAADTAMYRAKNAGRNRTVVFHGELPDGWAGRGPVA